MQRMRPYLLFIVTAVFCCSCATSFKNYNPDKKYPKQELQSDYTLLRTILEKKHPSLYWYTPKEQMDFYFDSLFRAIPDSMTELLFGWNILAPLTQKIHCGHTSFSMSKNWGKYLRNHTIPSFPLYMKIWGDTMVVTTNLNRKDSICRPGTVITSVNNLRTQQLIDKIFQYLPTDGYAQNVNYIRLSSNFPYFHRNVFGIYKNYRVGYIDSSGKENSTSLPLWTPQQDSSKKKKINQLVKIPKWQQKKERIENTRSLYIDEATSTATLILNTFSNGHGLHLRSFIKESFATINQQHLKNLIIDLRSNGGGDINMYVLLTKFIVQKPFKVSDTAYSSQKNFGPFTRYIKQGLLSNIGLVFLTRKQKDGMYHFGYWERHVFKPRATDHFNGNVYVLINGSTFSASTLFCNAVKGQQNVTIVGEEAGGGWYGNNGIMIPDIVLPVTQLRVRLPFFRLVQFNHVNKDGRGVIPDVYIPPSLEAVRNMEDRKMLWVKEQIKKEIR